MMNEQQSRIVEHIASSTSETVLSPKRIKEYASDIGLEDKHAYSLVRAAEKVGHGRYDISMFLASSNDTDTQYQQSPKMTSVSSVVNEDVYVPTKDKYFVKWGHFKDIFQIVKSMEFYPTFITGLSGNGKTMMVEQACARAEREYIRVQITPETDEDDLIGGFRLIDGETIFSKGPVIKAMERGAILLIDEIDRGSNKLMCLQGVLEGKPIMIKKTGEMVNPARGFNVITTANTKGQGSEDGRFVSATIIDDAFLERFIITVEQPYPGIGTERRIVNKHMEKFGCSDENFTEMLVNWADTIRKTYNDGGVDEQISTRRLCHIVQTFSIFNDRKKAVSLCVNRFDEDTKDAFLDLYDKVDATVGDPSNPVGDGSTDDYGVSFEGILDSALTGNNS